MKFKKIDEDTHGPVVSVISDKGFVIGSIRKWHGLFITSDWEGNASSLPHETRKAAAEALSEQFEFAADQSA